MSKQQEFRKQTEEAKLEAFSLMCKKVAELEKENAELKHTIAELRRDKDNLNTHAKAQEKLSEYRSEQLTKAKDLLKKWVELFKPKGGNIPPTPIQVDTEQFISEVEK